MRLLQTLFTGLLASLAFTLLLLAPSAGPQGVSAIRLPGLAPGLGLNLLGVSPGQFPMLDVFNSFSYDESLEHFWERARNLGDKVVKYANNLLEHEAKVYPTLKSSISSFQHQISSVLSSPGIQTLHSELEKSASFLNATITNIKTDITNINTTGLLDLTKWSNVLSIEYELIMDEFQREFPPPSESPNHEERVKLINTLMDRLEDGFVKVANSTHYGWHGMDQEKAGEIFMSIRPGTVSALVTVGDITEQHPVLLETILFAGAALIIPEAWIARPLFSCFGFGPLGPVKGSTAAWAQRRFWGAAVAKNSWFSHLQSAGMTGQWGKIPKVVAGIISGIVGLSFGLCRRG